MNTPSGDSQAQRGILILQDDKRFAKTLEAEFRDRGFQVFRAHNLKDLDLLAGNAIHAAVVDLRLGQDSGLTAIEALVKRHPGIRIVVLTGYGSIATAVESLKKGAFHYLTKPVSIEVLAEAIGGNKPAVETDLVLEAGETLAQHERGFIESILLQCQGNISAAAKRLGIHRQSLQRKLKKFSG